MSILYTKINFTTVLQGDSAWHPPSTVLSVSILCLYYTQKLILLPCYKVTLPGTPQYCLKCSYNL